MINYILNCLNNYNINLEGKKVVVGVSTGVDSMTLLHGLERLPFKVNIIVCHVNHGKREQSTVEETFIRNYCNEHHHKLYCLNLTKHNFSNHNFQEEARLLRQKFFYEVMDKEEANTLLLAHHLNDDIETMLMRMIRGSNLKGYSGIDEFSKNDNKIILRPFLKVLKKEILEYAKANKIVYYDDYTNFEDIYTRNKIRNNVVKELFKVNDNVHLKFMEFKNTINEASIIVNEKRDEFINNKVLISKESISFKKDDFLSNNEFLEHEILFELLKEYKFSKQNISELIKLVKSDKQNIKTIYKNITFVKEYNDIIIYFYELKKEDINIVIDGVGVYPVNEKYEIVVTKKNNNLLTTLNKLWYNSNMLPIVIRSRKDGDKISLECGTKKVKKLLIDEKVGILKREEVLLIEKEDEVLAVLGYGKSIKLKALKDCDLIIELKEKQNDYSSMH